MAGDRFAIDALGLFGEPFHEGRAIEDLAPSLGKGFALFGGQDGGQIVGVFDHQVEPFAQDGGAVLGCFSGPCLLRDLGLGDRFGGLCAAEVRDLGDHVAAGWVGDFERAAAIDPCAGDIATSDKQRGVLEMRGKISCLVEHDWSP